MPRDHTEDTLDLDAKRSVSGMLHSLSSEWNNYFPSKTENNEFINEAEKIDALEETLDIHPKTMKFMYEITKLHHDALNNKAENAELKQSLAGLADYIASVTYEAHINDEVELSPQQLKILDVLKMSTAQDAANAGHKFLKQIGGGMRHVLHELKEHPKTCAAFGTLGVGSLWFMNQKLGSKIYLDPTMMTATNITNSDIQNVSEMSDEALFEGVEDGTGFDGTSTFDVNQLDTLDTDMQFGIHSELAKVLNLEQEQADTLRENPIMGFIFPERGFTLDTYVYDAQQNLVNSYEFLYGERYDFGLKESTLDMGASLLPHPELFNAYTKGAELLTDFWTGYDWIENIAVHPPMTIFTMLAVYKLGTMNAGEFAEFKGDLKDTWHTATHNSRLPYTGAATGMISSLVMNSGLDPSIVWMGLAGMLAGETVKRVQLKGASATLPLKSAITGAAASLVVNGFDPTITIGAGIAGGIAGGVVNLANSKGKNSEFVKNSTQAIRSSLDSFANPDLILSNNKAGEMLSISNSQTNGWSATAIATGTLAAATTVDYLTTGGQITAGTIGGAVVSLKFWALNAVQELGLHGIFAGMGAILGGAAIAIKRGRDAISKNDNDNSPD